MLPRSLVWLALVLLPVGASAFDGPVFELSSLDGGNGFVLNGVAPGDLSGSSVSGAGDLNGDGLDDLLIGAAQADSNGESSGGAYVVFGSCSARRSAVPAT